MVLFGLTSILGQWVLGKESFNYITTQFIADKDYTKYYSLVFFIILCLAPHFSFKTVWYIQDIALGILILPNLFAINNLIKKIKIKGDIEC